MTDNRWSAVRSVSSLLALALLAACSSSDSSGPKIGPPATITAVSGATQNGQAGVALTSPLVVKVADAQGQGVSKAIVSFQITAGGGTLSQTVDTTDAEGTASVTWTVGSSVGIGRVEARSTGLVTPATFNVDIKAGPAALLGRTSDAVGTTAAGFELNDSVAVRVTDQFNNPVAGQTVTFAVTAGGGTVSAATRTTGDDGIARTAWKIGTTGTQTLRATAGTLAADISGTAADCAESTLAVGDILTLTPGSAQCVILNGTARNYIITVVNPTNSPGSTAAFKSRGAGGAQSTNTTTEPVATSFALNSLPSAMGEEVRESFAERTTHAKVLRASADVMERLGAPRRTNTSNLSLQVAPPNVGDMISMKIPTNFNDLCSPTGAVNVRARVLYVGTRGIMLEDSANTLAGQLDTLYRAIGEEFDNVMFPILQTNFGNPLAMDAQTNNDGHIYMLFSTKINTIQGGTIAGFVSSGDFFPANQCPGTNFGEVFYARAPTVAGPGFTGETAAAWARGTRTVIIHEVKHIVSFAEKLSRGGTPNGFFAKDQWLEESSAMLVEELWGRGIFNLQPKTNISYANSIYCEVRPTQNANWPQCQPTKPLNIFDHFINLYDFVSDPEGHSMVGPVATGDFTFYGSGWIFLRWLIENYVPSESAFLKAMTAETVLPGIENIQARTGKTFQDLLSEFSLALTLDDYPSFTPKDAKYSIQSWNTRNIFAGMSADFSNQNFFTNPTPLRIRPGAFGKFAIDVGGVHGGGWTVMQISGTQSNKQLLEFKGVAGTVFPPEMRINVVRVQ